MLSALLDRIDYFGTKIGSLLLCVSVRLIAKSENTSADGERPHGSGILDSDVCNTQQDEFVTEPRPGLLLVGENMSSAGDGTSAASTLCTRTIFAACDPRG